MRTTSFDSTRGSWLDRLIWRMRVRKVRRQIGWRVNCVVDLGCGRTAPLLRELLSAGIVQQAIGVDLDPAEDVATAGLRLVRSDLNDLLPLADGSTDVVMSLAVIEHLVEPLRHLQESFRVLRPGGQLLLTTPSPRGKPVLEFLAYKLGVIDRAEIEDHKNYFNSADLTGMLKLAGFQSSGIRAATFQFGMNNVVSAVR